MWETVKNINVWRNVLMPKISKMSATNTDFHKFLLCIRRKASSFSLAWQTENWIKMWRHLSGDNKIWKRPLIISWWLCRFNKYRISNSTMGFESQMKLWNLERFDGWPNILSNSPRFLSACYLVTQRGVMYAGSLIERSGDILGPEFGA